MSDRFEREVAVFGNARRLSATERAAYLDEACAGDSALRQRVEELLRAGERAEGFLQEPAPGAQRPEPASATPMLVPNLPAPGEKAGDRIGRYKLLQQIGEGGCGIVYMAEQEEPVRRRVALKVIKLGMDTKQVIARFEAERQALAMMDHANIAKVLDAGTTLSGRPYFVMELVRGIKITEYCDEHNLSTKERLDLFMQVCQAVQHAHQKGIIHRDLKPSNILVASDDGVAVSKVIDFGIAKATQGRLTDQTLFTAFEQFIGTPAYMSPEQAELTMQDVDTRSDIYSLGVLLYELLTGRTPFDAKELLAAGLEAMRRTIREQEPKRPSTRLSTMLAGELTTTARHRHTEPAKLIHSLRGDLDWIVMKCLEKDRGRRYETANGLASDVRRHLHCEPVMARPPSRLYEFQKTVRRHKFGFGAAGALIIVLAVGGAANTLEAIRATRAEAQARVQQVRARRSADEANAQRAIAELSAQNAKQEEARANEQASLARRRLYAAQISLAYQAWDAGNSRGALELLESQRPELGQEDLRTFEWRHLWGLCQAGLRVTLRGHTRAVTRVAFSPDGKTLASASTDETIRLWNVATGQERTTLHVFLGSRGSLAFSPDGKMLVTGGYTGQGKAWDLTTEQALPVHFPQNSIEGSVAFSPDGKTLAGGNFFGLVKLWDVATWQEKERIEAGTTPVDSLMFTPDGQHLVSAVSWKGDTKLWDLSKQPAALTRSFRGRNPGALSPDGAHLALVREDGAIQLYDVASGAELSSLPTRYDEVSTVAFSPDGMRVGFGGQERLAGIWDLGTGGVQTFAHRTAIFCVAFSPDGKVFATAGEDGTIKLWDSVKSTAAAASFPNLKGGSPVFCPDGTTLAFIGSKSSIELFDLATGQTRTVVAQALPEAQLAFSADGTLLAESAGSWDVHQTEARLHDLRSGRQVASFKARNLTFSPDGKMFATANTESVATVQLWNLSNLRPIVELKQVPFGRLTRLAFSPDAKALAGGGQFDWLNLWDVTNGEDQASLQISRGAYHWLGALAFAPDSKLLAAGNWDGTVNLWDLAARTLRASFKGHTAQVTAMAFFPDGKTLVTGSADRTCKFWDVATGQERLTLKNHSPEANSLAISPDGTVLASVMLGGTITLRRAAMDKEAAAWQPVTDPAGAQHGVGAPDAWVERALAQAGANRWDTAMANYGKAISLIPKALFTEKSEAAALCLDLAARAVSAGRFEAAEAISRNTIALYQEIIRENPAAPELRISLGHGEWQLAAAQKAAGKRELAERSLRGALETFQQAAHEFPAHPFVRQEEAFGHRLLGDTLQELGRVDEAEREFRAAAVADAAFKSEALGNALYRDDQFLADRTRELLLAGRFAEAEPVARQCLALREKAMPTDWKVFNARAMLGGARLGQKDYGPETETNLLAGYRGLKEREAAIPPAGRPRLYEAVQRLVQLYEESNRPEQAAEWKSKLGEFDPAAGAARGIPAQEPSASTNLIDLSPSYSARLPAPRDGDNSGELPGVTAATQADQLARLGRWKEAASCAATALQIDPTNHWNYHKLASLLVQIGEVARYRSICVQAASQFGGTPDPVTAERMAKFCLILPESGIEPTTTSRWADAAVTFGRDPEGIPWYQFVKGLSEYRTGHYPEAVDWAGRALRYPNRDFTRDLLASALLAMGQYKLNETNAARATLVVASELEAKLPPADGSDFGQRWPDWVYSRALLREARALIEGQPPVAKQ